MGKLPSDWKACGTCAYWTGTQRPADAFCNYTEFQKEKAKCMGGGFNNCPMSPNASCSKWMPRFKKR